MPRPACSRGASASSKEAQKTDGKMMSRALLLSDDVDDV